MARRAPSSRGRGSGERQGRERNESDWRLSFQACAAPCDAGIQGAAADWAVRASVSCCGGAPGYLASVLPEIQFLETR